MVHPLLYMLQSIFCNMVTANTPVTGLLRVHRTWNGIMAAWCRGNSQLILEFRAGNDIKPVNQLVFEVFCLAIIYCFIEAFLCLTICYLY